MRLALLVALLASSAASGCAAIQTNADGSRRIVGWVALDLPAPEKRIAGDAMRVRTIGLGLALTQPATTLTIGYADAAHVLVHTDSCAALANNFPGTPR